MKEWTEKEDGWMSSSHERGQLYTADERKKVFNAGWTMKDGLGACRDEMGWDGMRRNVLRQSVAGYC